jgi:hypothetical protein
VLQGLSNSCVGGDGGDIAKMKWNFFLLDKLVQKNELLKSVDRWLMSTEMELKTHVIYGNATKCYT